MDVILARIRELAAEEIVRVTQHAQVEMDTDEVTLDEVLAVCYSHQRQYAELRLYGVGWHYLHVLYPTTIFLKRSQLEP